LNGFYFLGQIGNRGDIIEGGSRCFRERGIVRQRFREGRETETVEHYRFRRQAAAKPCQAGPILFYFGYLIVGKYEESRGKKKNKADDADYAQQFGADLHRGWPPLVW